MPSEEISQRNSKAITHCSTVNNIKSLLLKYIKIFNKIYIITLAVALATITVKKQSRDGESPQRLSLFS
jgi:hypothetical protein